MHNTPENLIKPAILTGIFKKIQDKFLKYLQEPNLVKSLTNFSCQKSLSIRVKSAELRNHCIIGLGFVQLANHTVLIPKTAFLIY